MALIETEQRAVAIVCLPALRRRGMNPKIFADEWTKKRACANNGFLDNNHIMNVIVANLTKEVRALPPREFDQFLSWLSEFEAEQMDEWDRDIERDSRKVGRLKTVLARVRADIVAGRTKPLTVIISEDILPRISRITLIKVQPADCPTTV